MSSEPIPKVLNFFWANETMSWLRYLSLWSARKLNPDWDIRLYLHSPEESYGIGEGPWVNQKIAQDFFTYDGVDYLDGLRDIGVDIRTWNPQYFVKSLSGIADALRLETPLVPEDSTPSHRSNYFKWFLLATEGGFYSDNDILFIKPLSEFYDKFSNHDMLISYHENDLYFSIGFLGSKGNCEPYRDFYAQALKGFSRENYQAAGVRALNTSLGNPSMSKGWEPLIGKYPKLDIANMGMSYFYPYESDEVEFYFEKEPQHIDHNKINDAIGLHWYAGHPTSQKWNNILAPDNVADYEFLVPREIRRLFGSEVSPVQSPRRLDVNF